MKTEILIPNIKDSQIVIRELNYNGNWSICDWHVHREYEFYILTEGQKAFYVNDKSYVMQKGDIAFINKRIPHKTQFFENTYGFLMQVGPDFALNFPNATFRHHINHLGKAAKVFKANTEINIELTACFNEIINEVTKMKASYEMYVKALTYKFFAILYRHNILIEPKLNSKEIERILPVLNYIEDNYREQITLNDMAKLLNVDKSHFCRIFKKATNSSFMNYLNYVRICNAETLLLLTQKRISEISEETGFSSPSYFTETFKHYLQYPPGYYRKTKDTTY